MGTTRSEFRALLALNRHKLGRRLPRPAPPDGQARVYHKALKKITQSAVDILKARLIPYLKAHSPTTDSATLDVKDRFWDQRQIVHEIQQAQAEFWKHWSDARIAGLVEPTAGATQKFQAQALNAQLRPAVGLDVVGSEKWLTPVVGEFVSRNVALIKSIPTRFYAEVQTLVAAEAGKGERWENLAKVIEDRFGVSESRAKLIARDQVSKFYGELNRARQKDLGITKATWRTANDNRVREEHVLLAGTVYELSNPPEGGPGHPVGCRCYDDPDLESALADIAEAEQPDQEADPIPQAPEFEAAPVEAAPVEALPVAPVEFEPPTLPFEVAPVEAPALPEPVPFEAPQVDPARPAQLAEAAQASAGPAVTSEVHAQMAEGGFTHFRQLGGAGGVQIPSWEVPGNSRIPSIEHWGGDRPFVIRGKGRIRSFGSARAAIKAALKLA